MLVPEITDNGAISSVDVTKNGVAFTHALFDLFAGLSMKNQQVKVSCKEGNTWGEEACFYKAMFDEDILSSSKKKEKFDLRERDLQGLIPWGFIVHMIRRRGLKALLLGRNKFKDHELPHDLDLDGLEDLDLSSIGSLGGKRRQYCVGLFVVLTIVCVNVLNRPPPPADQHLENVESVEGQRDTTERYCRLRLLPH
jgi:hypothetical protein